MATTLGNRLEEAPLLSEPILSHSDINNSIIENEGSIEDGRPTRESTTPLFVLLAVGLLLGVFTTAFDMSFLITNYNRTVASDLHNLANAAWIVLSGSISESASQPLYSHISQSWGVEFPMVFSVVSCTLGFLLCSIADSLWQLSLSRIVVGLGSTGISFLTVIVISDLVSVVDLPLWKSGVMVARTVAEMIGGPAGSALASRLGWRWTFGIESSVMFLATMIVATSVILAFARHEKLLPKRRRVENRQFDKWGAISLILAVASPLAAISMGGGILPWSHPLEIALLALSPVQFLIFYYVETRIAQSPIIPMRFLRDSSAIKIFVASFGIVFAFNSIIFNLSLYVDVRSEPGSSLQDWALSLVFGGRPVGAFFSGLSIKHFKRFKALFLANLLMSALLYVSLAVDFITPEVPGPFCVTIVLIGLAIGVSESCLIVGLFSIVSNEDSPSLYAVFDLIIAFAADSAIAISNGLMRLLLKRDLNQILGHSIETEKIIRKSLESLDYVRQLPNHLRIAVLKSMSSAIRDDYVLSSILIIIGIAGALRMRELPYQKHQRTETNEEAIEETRR